MYFEGSTLLFGFKIYHTNSKFMHDVNSLDISLSNTYFLKTALLNSIKLFHIVDYQAIYKAVIDRYTDLPKCKNLTLCTMGAVSTSNDNTKKVISVGKRL